MSTEDNGAVRITLRDVYEVVQGTAKDVAEMKVHVSSTTDTVTDHEKRIRAVEKRVWALPSLAGVIAVAGLVVSIVSVVTRVHH